MPRTLGYHVVKSGYGLWLPGDDRGSWSEAWDARIGYMEPHTLQPGDAVRHRMATERMKHPAVRLSAAMTAVVERVICECARHPRTTWKIAAASIEPTHTHLLITYSGMEIDNTTKWIADQTTKAVHRETEHGGPVWCKNCWSAFVYEAPGWNAAAAYIERHNERRGVGPRPYDFVTPVVF